MLKLMLTSMQLSAVAAALTLGQPASAGEVRPLAELLSATHVHGLAFDRNASDRLLLATHHGLHALDVDTGMVESVAQTQDDFMGFTPHPSDPGSLYASGHPAGGGNLGIIASEDGGRTWRRLSSGAGGPVDFHQMTASRADASVLYGVHGGVQVSRDGGRSWDVTGPAPEGLIDIAASGEDPGRLYAATRDGMFVSEDSGATWQRANLPRRPVSMVEVTGDGSIFAFVVGNGLIQGDEASWTWRTLSNGFGEGVPLHFAVDPADAARMVVATHEGALLTSRDGGRSWTTLGAP